MSILRGIGVDTALSDNVFDVSISDHLGFSEVGLVQQVIDRVKILVEMEMLLTI